jgi:hypothetical protein
MMVDTLLALPVIHQEGEVEIPVGYLRLPGLEDFQGSL